MAKTDLTVELKAESELVSMLEEAAALNVEFKEVLEDISARVDFLEALERNFEERVRAILLASKGGLGI